MSGQSLGLLCLKITQTAFGGGWGKILQEISEHYPTRLEVAILLSLFTPSRLEQVLRNVPVVWGPALVIWDTQGQQVWFWRQEVTSEVRGMFKNEEGEIVVFQVKR